MKNILLSILFFSKSLLFSQVTNCCTTHVYEGSVKTQDSERQIKLNFLVLLDSTIVGSYHYNPKSGSFKLAGTLYRDNTFSLNARDSAGLITNFFHGKIEKDYKSIAGIWTNPDETIKYPFKLNQVFGTSYWDFIKKNRALYEYKSLKKAIRKKRKVLSIDVASQNLEKLPDDLIKLRKIVSFNLLGNEFTEFPVVLSRLTSLDEISLSSNRIHSIGPEIGDLNNLRILILNNNSITKLPKEIGKLTNLLYLELGNNQITSLPEEIQFLTNLQELHIERNRLSDFEKKRLKKLLPNCIIHF